MEKPEFAQLWNEEVNKLAKLAEVVPKGGTIVEIGTAEGGSAFIFDKASRKNNVKIYSVDLAPTKAAYKNLDGTDVEIIKGKSVDVASKWQKITGRPTDLLFIDGAHDFKNVYEDFNAWVRHLVPGGTIVFHDYDPPERGGIAHFGVQVCLDGLLASNILSDDEHWYKLLIGKVDKPTEAHLELDECKNALRNIDKGIREASDRVCEGSPEEVLDTLRNKRDSFTSVQACYCLSKAMESGSETLYAKSGDSAELLRLTETLSMLDLGCGPSIFTGKGLDISDNLDAEGLSRIIAREQVRLAILLRALQTLVEWHP